MAAPKSGKMQFLLVEDNPQDARLLMEAFRETQAPWNVHHFTTIEKGWKALQDAMKSPERLPDVVLLDLKFPGTSGHEFLQRLRAVPMLDGLPVIILTSSPLEADVERARGLRANMYVVKPLTIDGYIALARDLVELWMDGRLGAPR